MSELSEARIPDAPAIQRLPLLQLILVGLQHVLLMYGGAIAVPLIIGQAAGLSREEIAFLINADLLVAGIATIVQSLGIGPMGIRMPVMMGASFAAVGSMVAMAGMPGIGLQGIFGATIAAGFFGMIISLVQMTGVRCRSVTIVAGGLLVVLSLLPKAAFLVASIPPAVLGGAAIAMFGMVAATGIKILQEAYIGDRRNQLLVAVSIGMALIPVVRPEFFAHLPLWMSPITHSGIAMATLSALSLNLLFNILGGAERAAINDSHAHPH